MNREILEAEAKIKTDPYNPAHYIALARAYLDAGDEGKARKVVATRHRLPSRDPAIHCSWADLAEELGMARLARECLEVAIALDPASPDYHYRLALLYHEKGATERVLKLLQKVVSLQPDHLKAKALLSELYRELGLQGAAFTVVGKTLPSPEIKIPRTLKFSFTNENALLFLDLFKGREVGYATFYLDQAGRLAHKFCDEVLEIDEIRHHIEGQKTIGIYPLRSDKTVKFCTIRIEIPRRKILEHIKDRGFLAIAGNRLQHYTNGIIRKTKDGGISSYAEKSSLTERKIWFFFEDFIPFELAERFLEAVLNEVAAPSSDLSVQLHVGFRGEGIGWKDEPIMLPLGISPLTGERCFFVNQEGQPFEDQLLFLEKIRKIGLGDVNRFLKIGVPKPSCLVPALSGLMKKLIARCPVISEIVSKARSGRNLRNEEKLVLFFTIGFLPDAEKMMHEILEPCPDYRPQKIPKMMPDPIAKPVSCPKIRQLLPEITAYLPCNCSFALPKPGYPTPLLHVHYAVARFGIPSEGSEIAIEGGEESPPVVDIDQIKESDIDGIIKKEKTGPSKVSDFEDLDEYRRLSELHVDIDILARGFPDYELGALASDLRRSSSSAAACIASGWNSIHGCLTSEAIESTLRGIQLTIHHLHMAFKKGYISEAIFRTYKNRYLEIASMLTRRKDGV